MIPRWREFPVFRRRVAGCWRDRLPARTQARYRAVAALDWLGWRLLDAGHYQAATLVWRAAGLW